MENATLEHVVRTFRLSAEDDWSYRKHNCLGLLMKSCQICLRCPEDAAALRGAEAVKNDNSDAYIAKVSLWPASTKK